MTLKEQRAKVWEEMMVIVQKADDEGREMNRLEAHEFDQLRKKHLAIKRKLKWKGFNRAIKY